MLTRLHVVLLTCSARHEVVVWVCRRLLSTDPEAAKEVVLAEKPVIADTSSNLEPALLDVLLANLSTLAAVYHKPPEVYLHSHIQFTIPPLLSSV